MNESILFEQVKKQGFKAMYCSCYHCPPEEFESRLFRRCFHWRARLLPWFVRLLCPNLFKSDLIFLQEAARAEDDQQLQLAISNYKLDCYRDPKFLHDKLMFRISCRKVLRVFAQLNQQSLPAHSGPRDVSGEVLDREL